MATAQTIVDRVKAQGGFDVTDAEALVWVDERHKEMVVDARFARKTVTIGTTVAGTAFYSTASAGIVEAFYFTVNDVPYGKAVKSDVYAYSQGSLVWVGQGTTGLLVADANSSAVTGLTLIPTPDTAGLLIKAYAAVRPDTLTLAGTVLVPDEYLQGLTAGAVATGAELLDEDDRRADRMEAKFQARTDKLRRMTERQFAGSGPSQIRVQGINA